MAKTAEQLQAAIDRIDEVLSSGVNNTRFPDGSAIGVDLGALRTQRAALVVQLGQVAGSPVRTRIIYQPTAMRRY